MISTEMSVRLEENNFGLYGLNEMLLKGLKKVAIVKTENLMEKEDFKKNSPNEFKNKWHEKRMYGQFFFSIRVFFTDTEYSQDSRGR